MYQIFFSNINISRDKENHETQLDNKKKSFYKERLFEW